LREDSANFRTKQCGTTFELTFSQIADWMRLSFAQTYASCQGTEFDAPLRLHDTTHVHFSLRHLFVAMSRAKERINLDIT
jgi:hypothetical protein